MKGTLVALLIAVIVFSIYHMTRGEQQPENSAIQEKDAVLLLDQAKNADTYIVSYAKLSRPGFVFIYAVDQNGRKSVVGRSALLAAGEHVNIHVAKIAGAGGGGGGGGAISIHASIVADDGDGVFNEEKDTEIIFDGDGVAEAAEYTYAESPEVTTPEELADLLEENGYTVNDDAEDILDDALPDPVPPTNPATSTQPTSNQGDENAGPFIVLPMPRGNMMEVLPVP